MADKKPNKKSNHSPKHNQNPSPEPIVVLPDPDLEIEKGRSSLVDDNPDVDPGLDEGNLPSRQKVPGGSQNYSH